MNIKNVLVVGGVLLALLLGVMAIIRPSTVITQVPAGAQVGTEDTNPVHSTNGVEEWYYSSRFNQASTTICSFLTPNSTSTLVYAVVNFNTATSGSLTVDIAKAATVNASTTLVASTITMPVSSLVTIVASSTNATYQNVFGPNMYLNVKYGAYATDALGLSSSNQLVGTCKAKFIRN